MFTADINLFCLLCLLSTGWRSLRWWRHYLQQPSTTTNTREPQTTSTFTQSKAPIVHLDCIYVRAASCWETAKLLERSPQIEGPLLLSKAVWETVSGSDWALKQTHTDGRNTVFLDADFPHRRAENAVPGHTSSSAAPSREYKLSKTGNRKTPINLINFTYENRFPWSEKTFIQKAGDSSCSDFTVLAPCEEAGWKTEKACEREKKWAPRHLLNYSYCRASSHTQHFIKI